MAASEPSIRILLVEDHKIVAEAVSWLLEELGLRVEHASNLQEALQRADHQQVLLTDYRLPDGTGIELLDRLGPRRMPRCLLMSAFLDDHIRSAALRMGFDACIDKKAFSDETLRRLILGDGREDTL